MFGNSITMEKFNESLKKALDDLKIAANKTQCNRIECELTDAYLSVEGDVSDVMFRVNVVSRYEFVMGMIFKKSVDLMLKGLL